VEKCILILRDSKKKEGGPTFSTLILRKRKEKGVFALEGGTRIRRFFVGGGKGG